MNLNLFRVLSPAEAEAQRQLVNREQWIATAMALGATRQQLLDYDARAVANAQTTLYPNGRFLVEARRAAREALICGKSLPADVEAAVRELWARELLRTFSR